MQQFRDSFNPIGDSESLCLRTIEKQRLCFARIINKAITG